MRADRPRRLPRLIALAIRIAWRAAPREVVGLVAAQLGGVAAMVGALLLGRHLLSIGLDASRAGGGLNRAIPTALLLTAATGAIGITRAVAMRDQRLLGELTLRFGIDRVLDFACAAELTDFDDPAFHDDLARGRAATQRLQMVVSSLAGLVSATAGATAAVVALLVLQPLLAPVALLALAPAWFAASRRGRLFYSFAYRLTPQDRERFYLTDVLASRDPAKEIRAYQLAPFLRGRHDSLYDERIRGVRLLARRQLVLSVVADLAAAAIIAGALLTLIALTNAHDISLAGAGAAVVAIALLGQRTSAAGSSAGTLSESGLFIEDLARLMDGRDGEGPPEAALVHTSLEPEPVEPWSIAAQHLTFSYRGVDRPALQDVSIAIHPGEVVALVGPNGSGKTTLAKLLAGLYLPEAGRVRWNGVDTSDCDRELVGRRIAVVFQDFMRYALTAYDNIALGRTERFADASAVEEAAREAGVDHAIRQLPLGYKSVLGPQFEEGVDLSLGQWQRMALARVYFREASFVILDEPTAALDAHAEEDLFDRIRALLAGRSVLLISHRFSTVRHADRIYVLEGGSIIEAGAHDDLVADDGLYAELFRAQAAAYG